MKATINGTTYEGTAQELAEMLHIIESSVVTEATPKATKAPCKAAKKAADADATPAPKSVRRRNGKRLRVMTAEDHKGLSAAKTAQLNRAVKQMTEAGFACHWRVIGEWAWLISDDRKGFTAEFKAMQPKLCTPKAQWSYSPRRGRMMIPGFYKPESK